MDELKIVLDHSNALFIPNSVCGHVYIRCREGVKARNLTLCINGIAKTHFRLYESGGSNNNGRHIQYYRDIVYLSQQLVLWQPQASDRLPSGETRFPFAFRIDNVMPPAMESKHAHIRYSLEAKVDIPNWPDKSTKLDLFLSPYFDLKFNTMSLSPVEKRTIEKVGSLFSKGQVDVAMFVHKSGFSVGEQLQFGLNIQNRSDREIYKLEIQIIQQALISADRHAILDFNWKFLRHGDVEYKRDELLVASIKKDIHWGKGKSDNSTYVIQVPQMTPSFTGLCSSIEVKHVLAVVLFAKGTFSDDKIECSVPIIIGHAPTQ